jgi:hypothetical protein
VAVLVTATAYIVFVQDASGTVGAWHEVGSYSAASADAAKQAAAVEHGDGTYSAAPARSWVPRKLKVAPRASFEDAS